MLKKWIKKNKNKIPENTYIELMGGDYDGMVVTQDVTIMNNFRVPIHHPIKINGKIANGPVIGYAIYLFKEINFDKEKPRALYTYNGKMSIKNG